MFDLDFTILPYDTMLLFCNFVLKKQRRRMLYVLVFLPAALPAALRLISSGTIKRFFFSFLWRMPRATVLDHAAEFVREQVMPLVFPEVRERIAVHKRRGDYLILNTASPYFYAEIIATELGFDACCATDLVLEERQKLLMQIAGRNNKREVKLDCMLPLFPAETRPTLERRRDFELHGTGQQPPVLPGSVAYSDSPADLPLLRLAQTAVLVAPGPELTALAPGHTWEILQPRLPFRGRMSRLLMMLRQALGFHSVRRQA